MVFQVIASIVEDDDVALLKECIDFIKQKIDSGVILLAMVHDKKIALIAGTTPDQEKKATCRSFT